VIAILYNPLQLSSIATLASLQALGSQAGGKKGVCRVDEIFTWLAA